MKIFFDFRIGPNLQFRPVLTVKNINRSQLKKIKKEILDNLVFHLGLIEIPSYWKVTCSPEIEIQAGYLNQDQIRWWKDLILKGMGQFFYENKIDWTCPNFLKITSLQRTVLCNIAENRSPLNRYLVPMREGKDSIVTMEKLRRSAKEINAFVVNPTEAARDVLRLAGIKKPILVERKIDSLLSKLNKKGYLNGHTPFTAVLSFLSVFCAVLFDYKHIAFSNEKSADEGNLKYLGKVINHQWSKSSEFENKFKYYCKKYLAKNIRYFSFLRKYTELEIARMFSRHPKYFPFFLSCNEAYKTDSGRRKPKKKWCGNCPKCLFVYAVLYSYLGEKQLLKIFGRDLFQSRKLLPIMKSLIGQGSHKPFECVGTYKESQKAFQLCFKKAKKSGEVPYLLQKYHEIGRIKKKNPAPNFAKRTMATASPQERSIRPRPSREFLKESPRQLSENLKTLWQNWYGARIAILGFGREGQDTFLFLRKLFPKKVLGIADERKIKIKFSKSKINLHLGRNYLKALKNYDLVIKSPGIPFKKLPKSDLAKITTQTDIFFQNCPGKIIGVTGTKGKSTTSSLIYQILKKGGVKAKLVGNIGKPVLTPLLKAKKSDVFVYELSSHQLYNLKRSPQIAVILNIYPEHLDYYRSFREYANVKANIARYQSKKDYLIYNYLDPIVKKISRKSLAKKLPIKGKYYRLNIAAAKRVGEIFKIPRKTIQEAVKRFKPLPHRLEFVGKFKGIEFYNDSLSTIPETTIEALDFLGDRVQTLILGGFDRGLDFQKLAERIVESNIKTLILFPTTGKRIWKEINIVRYFATRKMLHNVIVRHLSKSSGKKNKPDLRHFFVKDMEETVSLAYRYTEKGKICLLSPASPSFGLFKDYAERGDLFKKLVKKKGK